MTALNCEERIREATALYWSLDVPVSEIVHAYSFKHTADMLRQIGPARLTGVNCRCCGNDILCFSRSDFLKRRDDLLRKVSLVLFAMPDVCRDCSKKIQDEQAAFYRQQAADRENRLRQLAAMPYSEYLRSPEWKATRDAAVKRAGCRCQTCSAAGALHVHHRTYVRRGRESPKDLTVLCGDCHSLFHENRSLAEGGRAAF